jgi:molybdenum-dependent DNA-binding transcriptional regulator ModE
MEYQSPGPTTRQVSVSQASRDLGISPETVRRWIKSGRLQGERAIRPQGAMWLVTLPATTPRDVLPATAVTTPHKAVDQEPDQESDHATIEATSNEALHPSPAGTELIALVATVRQQSETIAGLTSMLERVMAELEALRASQTMQASQETVSASETTTELSASWWRSWAVYGVVGLVAIGAIGAFVVLMMLR